MPNIGDFPQKRRSDCQAGTQKKLTLPPTFTYIDLHTKAGTATGADGLPITKIKLPHVGGHEGVGRVVIFGPDVPQTEDLKIGTLVGIRFASRICHECEYCTSGREQHCGNATNHLHHEDGSFQQYCVLDTKYLTTLPQDIDPTVVGPALCAGVTAYKVSGLKPP